MPRPLVPLHQRDASGKATLERRVKALEIRADSALAPQTGVVSPSYTSGNPTVTVGSDTTATGPYQHLASYSPAANDPVALLWVAGAWVVIGKLA